MSNNDSNSNNSIQATLIRMEHILENLSRQQAETHDNVRQIKETMYNPDSGLYARVKNFEQWQSSVSKVLWYGGLMVVSLITKTFYDLI